MTTTVGCPRCSAPLTAAPACPACGLRLVGPDAQRLWELDQQLAPVLAERAALLARLGADPDSTGSAAPPVRRRTVQDVLLATGGLLLALAAVVFAAWSYGRLGPEGRVVALVLVAGLSAGAAPLATRRAMTSTAECAAGLAVALGCVALSPARMAGLLGAADLRPVTFYAVGTAVLAVVTAGYVAAVPTRAARIGAVLLAHSSVVFLLARGDAGPGAAGLVLAATAAVDAAAALATRGRTSGPAVHLRRVLLAAAVVSAVGALFAAITADTGERTAPAAGAYLLLAVATLLAGRATGRVQSVVGACLFGAASAQAALGPVLGNGGRALVVGICAVAVATVPVTGWPRAAQPAVPSADREAGLPGALRLAAFLLIAKAALLAAPEEEVPPGTLAAVGLAAAAVAAATLAWVRPWSARWPTALSVALLAAAVAAPDLPTADLRAGLVAAVGIAGCAAATRLPRAASSGAALAGGAAVVVGLWISLAGHDVGTVEAYTLPLAAGLLLGGLLLRRDSPTTDSVPAYGPGLVVLLTPTLLVALGDPAAEVTRLLLLLPAGVAVLLLGVARRLRAHVVAGSAGLTATALLLLVPYAEAVPRWVGLLLAGLLLVGVGATYEARRRDLDRARAALGALH